LKIIMVTFLLFFLLFLLTIGFDFLLGYPFRYAIVNSITAFSVMSKAEMAVLFFFIIGLAFQLLHPIYKKIRGK
jgi:hypothetical protein